MRILVAAIACVLLPGAAPAASSLEARTWGTRGDVLSLAAAGTRVAVVAAGGPGRCARIVVFDARSARFDRWDARSQCPGAETGAVKPRVAALALSATQVAWLETGGGNKLELRLVGAGLGRPGSYELGFAVNGAGAEESLAGQWISHLLASERLLVYNAFSLCDTSAEDGDCHGNASTPGVPGYRVLTASERLVRVDGRRRTAIRTHLATLTAVAVAGDRIAMRSADRNDLVIIYDRAGATRGVISVPDAPRVEMTAPGAPFPYALGATTLVVKKGRLLEVYAVSKGTRLRTARVRAVTVLRGAAAGLAAVVGGGTCTVIRLSDGREAAIRAPEARRGVRDCVLTGAGLAYAFNVRSRTATGRVRFLPLAELRRRLAAG